MEPRRLVVQKFGGTSVATADGRRAMVERVRERLAEGRQVVVVVSAMGRSGDPYATDTLIALARREGPVDARNLDLLMACGETIAAVVAVAALAREGIKANALTGVQAGVITDARHGDARVLRVEPGVILRNLDEGVVPVVTGFQGVSEAGEVTTLGRGGSDTTAAALGAALAADLVEIFTDVDGIKTADPRIVPDARTLETVTYEEVFQMAHQGAKVVHPRAVELAMRAGVPLRVRDARSPAPGTLIARAPSPEREWSRYADVATGVTQRAPVALIRVAAGAGEEVRVFRPVADAGISVDLVNISPGLKSFTVAQEEADAVERVLREHGFEVEVVRDCAKVSIVGSGVHGRPGVVAAMAEALNEAGISVLSSADSHITVSFLVPLAQMEDAVRALHRKFGLAGKPATLPDLEGGPA
ncbi:MAG: aspartate kinase [Clostridia bacterium]|nr:aspartate kinase [Clostridia bacterium]